MLSDFGSVYGSMLTTGGLARRTPTTATTSATSTPLARTTTTTPATLVVSFQD